MSLSTLINEYWYFILLIIFAATAVGFFAGLFGIGGGLISVPCLFFIFETLNIEKQYLMHLTVGTAFSITIMTSFVSVFTHNKHGVVDFNLLKSFGIFVVLGVICGRFFFLWLCCSRIHSIRETMRSFCSAVFIKISTLPRLDMQLKYSNSILPNEILICVDQIIKSNKRKRNINEIPTQSHNKVIQIF